MAAGELGRFLAKGGKGRTGTVMVRNVRVRHSCEEKPIDAGRARQGDGSGPKREVDVRETGDTDCVSG